jgi:protein-histidine pros-kinase
MGDRSPGRGAETNAERLVDASPDALIALTIDGTVLSWNRAAEAIFGYRADEMIGRSLDEELVPPEARDAAREAHREVLATGSAVFQTVQRAKDGRLVPVDATMRLATMPGLDPIIAIHETVVTPREARHDQRAFASKLSELIEAVPDAIVIVDQEGVIQLVNAETERLFGYSRDELSSRPVELLLPERLFAPGSAPRLPASGIELCGVRKDGSAFPVEISVRPLETEDGILVSSAIRDITARKQLEQRMREANRMKSELLAHMSHELRTPLNAIIGFAALMYQGKLGPMAPQHHEYLGDILTSSRHLLGVINDALDLAKIDAGKIELRPEEVELGAVVCEVRHVLRELAARKRLAVETVVDAGLGPVRVDPRRIKQVLYNFLANAIELTPEGGRITIGVAAEGEGSFRLSVRDTGIGIAPEDLPKLFVEFQQLDVRSRRKYPGTGLGLALTKSIVEAHGGRVEVESTPGAGSTFSAVVPKIAASAVQGK